MKHSIYPRRLTFVILAAIIAINAFSAKHLLIETEAFSDKGGWVLDQQFTHLMGSPYLMAHGMGIPVKDATTKVHLPKAGTWYVYARTYNWTSPWSTKEGIGAFQIAFNGTLLPNRLGCTGNQWEWQKAGKTTISNTDVTIALHDLTGFNGRCDALYFTTKENDIPPTLSMRQMSKEAQKTRKTAVSHPLHFDFVVVGGGVAGMCAAVSAARQGLKVALIHDRPILGGNNSSEVRVHLGGYINKSIYPELGNLIKEFGPLKGGNAQPAANYEDAKKHQWIGTEKNITLYLNTRAIDVIKKENTITSVITRTIDTGKETAFHAPIFADCTGDGSIGFMAGADYAIGRESRATYNEAGAPEKADSLTMGASVQWYSTEKSEETTFPRFEFGLNFNEETAEAVNHGEWTWETGLNRHQINKAEYIRDYGLMVIYSNWSVLKNSPKYRDKYRNSQLEWVAYIAGKRESRRLLGDHVLTENDIINRVEYPDASFPTTWSIDLHYPDPKNTRNFPDNEFKSIAEQRLIHPYPVPYRCLYSRNVDNLFMAGRGISVSHVALGTVRVMRTTGMMGEVVGMAASICHRHTSQPRDVYKQYLEELKSLMKNGAGKQGLPNNQLYNEGGTLE